MFPVTWLRRVGLCALLCLLLQRPALGLGGERGLARREEHSLWWAPAGPRGGNPSTSPRTSTRTPSPRSHAPWRGRACSRCPIDVRRVTGLVCPALTRLRSTGGVVWPPEVPVLWENGQVTLSACFLSHFPSYSRPLPSSAPLPACRGDPRALPSAERGQRPASGRKARQPVGANSWLVQAHCPLVLFPESGPGHRTTQLPRGADSSARRGQAQVRTAEGAGHSQPLPVRAALLRGWCDAPRSASKGTPGQGSQVAAEGHVLTSAAQA